jgi:hypothetical protein
MCEYFHMINGSLSPRNGASLGCVWKNVLQYGGRLRIWWISSPGHPTSGSPPAWELGEVLTNLITKRIHVPLAWTEVVRQVYMDFKKAYDSVRREVLYSILIESGIHMKLVSLIKMCLNEMYRQEFVWHVSYYEWFETGRCCIAIAFQLACGVRH